MMSKIKNILTIFCIVALFGCATITPKSMVDHREATEEELLNKKDPIGNYGQILSLEEVTDLDILLRSPNSFLNE